MENSMKILFMGTPQFAVSSLALLLEQGYEVAEACIRCGVHYIDLADGRDFVANIHRLDTAAKAAGVLVISGASTVPGLPSAVLTRYASEFVALEQIDFGIATAHSLLHKPEQGWPQSGIDRRLARSFVL